MNKEMVTSGENREPKRVDIYEEFVLWSAMPPSERMRFGVETQEQFCDFYKIGTNTPARWKRRSDYEARVTALRREWAFGKTGAVIEGIYRSALKGNPHSQKLWLQYFHNFSERQEVNLVQRATVSVDDMIFLIGALPKELQERHYRWMTELLHDASVAEQQAKREGRVFGDHLPADWKPRYRLFDSEVEDEVVVENKPKAPVVIHRHFASSCDSAAISQTATGAASATSFAHSVAIN